MTFAENLTTGLENSTSPEAADRLKLLQDLHGINKGLKEFITQQLTDMYEHAKLHGQDAVSKED